MEPSAGLAALEPLDSISMQLLTYKSFWQVAAGCECFSEQSFQGKDCVLVDLTNFHV